MEFVGMCLVFVSCLEISTSQTELTTLGVWKTKQNRTELVCIQFLRLCVCGKSSLTKVIDHVRQHFTGMFASSIAQQNVQMHAWSTQCGTCCRSTPLWTNPTSHNHAGRATSWAAAAAERGRQAAVAEAPCSSTSLTLLSRREGLLSGLSLAAAALACAPPVLAALSQPGIEQLEVRAVWCYGKASSKIRDLM